MITFTNSPCLIFEKKKICPKITAMRPWCPFVTRLSQQSTSWKYCKRNLSKHNFFSTCVFIHFNGSQKFIRPRSVMKILSTILYSDHNKIFYTKLSKKSCLYFTEFIFRNMQYYKKHVHIYEYESQKVILFFKMRPCIFLYQL